MPKRGYVPGPTGWKLKVEIYQSQVGKWYWHAIAKNGRTVADSVQGYTRKSNCLTGWLTIVTAIQTAAGRFGNYHRFKEAREEKNRTVIYY